MSRFGVRKYSDPGFVYGDSGGFSSLSVDPFEATAIDYDRVALSWLAPTGAYSQIRLVRNQSGVSDTAEDGIILLDESFPATVRDTRNFVDAFDSVPSYVNYVPLIPGQYAYYSIWLFLSNDHVWYQAGNAVTLIANQHETLLSTFDGSGVIGARTRNTHEKVMDLLPRVFTSTGESPTDEVDQGGALYNFLYGFSYTLDEFLTYIDLLAPHADMTNLPPALLLSASYELSLSTDNRASTRFQRQLVREAKWMYARKGTASALQTYVESMTGYGTTVLSSPNLMLSPQDSSFHDWQSYSDWLTMHTATITGIVSADGKHAKFVGANQFVVGQTIQITGMTPSAYNTASAIVVQQDTLNSTFTIESTATGAFVTGGKAQSTSFRGFTFWNTSGAATLSAENTVAAPTGEVMAIDTSGTAKVVTTAAKASVTLGNDLPVTRGIPVTGGASYTLSFYQQGGASNVTPSISCYDIWGTLISNTPGTAVATVSGTWTRMTQTITVPTNAAYVGFDVTFSAVGTFWLDMFQFARGGSVTAATGNGTTVTYTAANSFVVGDRVTISGLGVASGASLNLSNVLVASATATQFTVTNAANGTSSGTGTATYSFNEARGVNVLLAPNKQNILTGPSFETATSTVIRTNLVLNPNFEAGTANWTAEHSGVLTVDTASPIAGTQSAKLTGGGDVYAFAAVNAGDTVTFSLAYTTVGTLTGVPKITLAMPGAATATTLLPLTQTTPGRFSVTATGVTAGNAVLGVFSGAAADVIHFDSVLVEKSPYAGPYFDGSTAATNGRTYAWTSGANASTSTSTAMVPNGWTATGATLSQSAINTTTNPGPLVQGTGSNMLLVQPNGGPTTLTTTGVNSADVTRGQFHCFSIYARTTSATDQFDVTLTLSASASGATTISNSYAYSANGAITGATTTGSQITYLSNFTVPVGAVVTVSGINPASYNVTNAVVTSTTPFGFTVEKPVSDIYISGGTVSYAGANRISPTWGRFWVNVFVPANFGTGPVTLTPSLTFNSQDIVLLDAASLEARYTPSDYMDGDYVDAIWGLGQANAHKSDSFMYQNWTYKVPRLSDELDLFMPSGTPFVLSRVDGTATTISGAAVKGFAP